MRNGCGYVELVHALTRLGAVLVPLNTRLTATEVDWQLRDAGARILIHDRHNAALARRGAADGRIALAWELLPDADLADPSEEGNELVGELDLSSVHAVMYTSGTTGKPKGVMLTYGNHWWSAMGSALNLGLHDDDCWLACLPLFHVGGLSILFRSVIYGIPVVLHASFVAEAVSRSIDHHGVTIASLVPTMLQRLLDSREAAPLPGSLRCVLLGGGPVPRLLLERCAHLGIPVIQTYGLTETASQIATLAPHDALRKMGSAGKPLVPAELRIERDGRIVPAGEVGEIVLRGPMVMAGYFGRPDATERAIKGGWLQTGDLGYLDDEGYLYVVDRRDDLIVSGGENVYPAEVEAVLLAHQAVEEAGVAGVQDPTWGQVVFAAVKLKSGANVPPETLLEFCRERLARYKIPAHLEIVDALPRNAAGKLLRSHLVRLSAPRR
jgi:O-succinylbenzoic acid--CoA ligase